MIWRSFSTLVPAKWVLAGEHAVLKGATAVALPKKNYSLRLIFRPLEAGRLSLSGGGESQPEGWRDTLRVEPAVAGDRVRELVLRALQKQSGTGGCLQLPQGLLTLESQIPMGAGLGSSAALCVALARWIVDQVDGDPQSVPGLATDLEHRFHQKSSGMDVAVIAEGCPIAFRMGEVPTRLPVKELPCFTFYDTKLRSKTADCVNQVEAFRREYPQKAHQVDESMNLASQWGMQGLLEFQARPAEGLKFLIRAMQAARKCFYEWDLVPVEVQELEKMLLSRGALAVKLTGAGRGGVLVALWENEQAVDTSVVQL